MRVFVTGHQGYIGTVLVDVLRSAGHEVLGLDIGFFSDGWCGPAAEPESSTVDVRDVQIADLMDIDAVVHLAALSNDPLGALYPRVTDAVNFRASVRLARAAKAAGVRRFLFSSSCSVYGAVAGRPVTENDPTEPLSEYATSKIRTEMALSELADDTFTPTYLRNATAYGYSPRLRTDLVVNDLTVNVLATGQVRLHSDGRAWRPLIHVEDISHAVAVMLEAPPEVIGDRAYNVGADEENYLVRDVAEIVHDMVPGSHLSIADGAPADRRSYRVDFGRIGSEVPAFKPRWTVRDGVQQMIEAFAAAGIPPAQLAGPAFRRLEQLRAHIEAGSLTTDLRRRR